MDLDYWPSCFLYKTDIDATLTGKIAKAPTTLNKKLTSIGQLHPRVPRYTHVLSLSMCLFFAKNKPKASTHFLSTCIIFSATNDSEK